MWHYQYIIDSESIDAIDNSRALPSDSCHLYYKIYDNLYFSYSTVRLHFVDFSVKRVLFIKFVYISTNIILYFVTQQGYARIVKVADK